MWDPRWTICSRGSHLPILCYEGGRGRIPELLIPNACFETEVRFRERQEHSRKESTALEHEIRVHRGRSSSRGHIYTYIRSKRSQPRRSPLCSCHVVKFTHWKDGEQERATGPLQIKDRTYPVHTCTSTVAAGISDVCMGCGYNPRALIDLHTQNGNPGIPVRHVRRGKGNKQALNRQSNRGTRRKCL